MPQNKYALIRYRLIDTIIRNPQRPYPSMEDIKELLEDKLGKTFSVSTIQKDIKAMKEDEALGFNAPITFSKLHNGYFYSDPNFTIASVPLNENDIEAIDFATLLLDQFKNVPILEQYSAAVDKIMEAVNIRRILDDYTETTFVQFEKVPYVKGNELLGQLITAIKSKKVINVVYKKFDSDDEKKHVIHPYLLKEYRNRWYLVGMHDDLKSIITLGLDRIVSIEITDIERKLHPGFDPDYYYKYAFGIIANEEEPQEIILSFTPLQGKYIKTQPLHHSQQILIDNQQEFRISIKVWPTVDLRMQILGYGPNVKVISPTTFADEVAAFLSETLAHYKSS